MSHKQVNLGNTLTSEQAEIIKRKLRNMSEISVVPLVVAENSVIIGFDPEEAFKGDWQHILSQMGYRAHSV